MTDTHQAAIAAIRTADTAIDPIAIEAELRVWWPSQGFGSDQPSPDHINICIAFGRHLLNRGGLVPIGVTPPSRNCGYPSAWFDGRHALKNPPPECVSGCSSQGRVDQSIRYWVEKLNLSAPPWFLRQYLKGTGAWERDELCDHDANLERLLWIWCCNLREDPDFLMYLGT